MTRPRHPDNLYPFVRALGRGINWILGIKIIIENQELVESKDGPRVYISNHQSNLDFFVIGPYTAKRTVSIGKKSILYIPLFGIFYWLSGNITIDRSNKRKAISAMNDAIKTMHKQNLSLFIMPEGTRSKGRGVLPFKKGAFHTAIKAQAAISPICVSSFPGKLNFNKLHSGTVRIKVLPPIPTKGMTTADARDLCEKCYTLVKDNVEALDKQLEERS
jgi:1-acyl-sn-glycerol-3-phosphate acyltransferase